MKSTPGVVAKNWLELKIKLAFVLTVKVVQIPNSHYMMAKFLSFLLQLEHSPISGPFIIKLLGAHLSNQLCQVKNLSNWTKSSLGANAIKTFTPSIRIPYLGV